MKIKLHICRSGQLSQIVQVLQGCHRRSTMPDGLIIQQQIIFCNTRCFSLDGCVGNCHSSLAFAGLPLKLPQQKTRRLCKCSNCLTITVGSKELHLWRLRIELVEWANRLPWWRSPRLQSLESWWAQVWKMILGGLFVSCLCIQTLSEKKPNPAGLWCASEHRFPTLGWIGKKWDRHIRRQEKVLAGARRSAWNWNCDELCCLPNALVQNEYTT